MTENKGIFIRNIYYMLSYAFQELRKNNYEDIAREEFVKISDLFAEILYKGLSAQLKQGLYRAYEEKAALLATLRGRVDMNKLIMGRINGIQRLACEYDELSGNNVLNRIIKSTAILLIKCDDVSRQRKSQLRSILPYLNAVDEIDLKSVKWTDLSFNRHNHAYRMLINICCFVADGMLMTTDSGRFRMPMFSDDHMERLFERFVLAYYSTHHKDLKANADIVNWNVDVENSRKGGDLLPEMRTDITMRKNDRQLIIDTKYYGKMTQMRYGRIKAHSDHLYQIFAYVKNRDLQNAGNVSGLVLYARSDDKFVPDFDGVICNNRFMIRTLDLNRPFDEISDQLDRIAAEFF